MILYKYIYPERTGFFSKNSSNTLKNKDSKELNDEESILLRLQNDYAIASYSTGLSASCAGSSPFKSIASTDFEAIRLKLPHRICREDNATFANRALDECLLRGCLCSDSMSHQSAILTPPNPAS